MPYPLTSADCRDRAALRRLKADVFEKRRHIHEPEGFAPGRHEGTNLAIISFTPVRR
jgi:hypothetical protein